VSASTALSLCLGSAAARLPAITDPRFKAGIVMEALELRRVLSAGAVAVPSDVLFHLDPPIQVNNDPSTNNGGDSATDTSIGDTTDDSTGDISMTDLTGDTLDVSDPGNDTIDNTDDGTNTLAWPDGWAWTLDREPTADEVTALLNGDQVDGWVPVDNFGGLNPGDGTDGVDSGISDNIASDQGGPVDVTSDPNAAGDPGQVEDPTLLDGTGDFPVEMLSGGVQVNFFSRGDLPNQRNVDSVATTPETPLAVTEATPASTSNTPQPSASADLPGGRPPAATAPSSSDDPSTSSVILGKVKKKVTADESSDLPFLR
jgi:hypothetical protein